VQRCRPTRLLSKDSSMLTTHDHAAHSQQEENGAMMGHTHHLASQIEMELDEGLDQSFQPREGLAQPEMKPHDALKFVSDNLRESIQNFIDEQLFIDPPEATANTPRTGFISRKANDADFSEVRDALEGAVFVCKQIAAERSDMSQVGVNTRKLASVLQANTQAVLIEFHAMNLTDVIPESEVSNVMRQMNSLQSVVRDVELNLDILLATSKRAKP
jgi:hypothetical protein